MNRTFFTCILLTLSALAYAQSVLVIQLANQVCRCMETNDRTEPPSEQARECVRIVGLRHKQKLLEELSLRPENPVELALLSERMAEYLSRNCPVLSTLRLDDAERELRWSDRNTVRKAATEDLRYQFPKNPPPAPPDQTVSESPEVWRVTGSIVGRPGRGTLQLRLPDGKIETFEFPAKVSRRVDLAEGQVITVVYDRQWRKVIRGGVVALIVRKIE